MQPNIPSAANQPAGMPYPGQPQATQNTAPQQVTHRNPNSTQNALRFSELRDNMVIMADGDFRAVVAAQSINFDLMSARERDGIELSYQDFLNSLTFPIQIYIKSEKVDIGPYLNKLQKLRLNQDNMLLGVLMDDYIAFINALAQEANIMDKSFFVVIPYMIGEERMKTGASSSEKGVLTSLFTNSGGTQNKIKVPAEQYQRAKDEINNRVNAVIDGLSQAGIRSVRLNTKELGELYYNIYNPDTAIRQPIGDFKNYTHLMVTKGQGQASVKPLGEMW